MARVTRNCCPSVAPRSRRDRAQAARRGLTLIEIMIVVVIVAIASGGVSIGLGALTRTSLRSACVRLVALSRFAYHRALTNGTTVRVSFDLSNGTFSLTEAHGRVTLVRSDSPMREEAERASNDDEQESKQESGAAVDPWEAARLRIEQPDTLVLPKSPFSALTTPSGATIARYTKQPVGDDVRVVKVIVAHEAKPRDEGVADLFYFPSGLTQHALVQLEDRNQVIYSVEIHPLTGRAKVHDVPYEPDVLMDDPTLRDEQATELEDRL